MSLLTFTDRKSGVKRNEIMSLQQILLLSKLWHKINTAATMDRLPPDVIKFRGRNGVCQFDLFMSGATMAMGF